MEKSKIGNRMKEFYENRQKICLIRRTPVIIRLDGKAFHTFTRGLEQPFDIANFDSRSFNIPKEDVCNYFIWRQQDCTRNSINMVAQSEFSHKQLQGKNTFEVQNMLMLQKQINWNNFSTSEKRGTCVVKKNLNWEIDYNIPIFTTDRNYIENLL